MDLSSSNDKKKIYILGAAIMALVIVIVLVVVLSAKKSVTVTNPIANVTPADVSITPVGSNTAPSKTSPVQGAIAKVGEEYLYESDLNYELTYYPANDPEGARDILTQKMIEDSIILQGAQADGMIRLDPTIYNSKTKDYSKRIDAVAQLKDQLDQKSTALEGTVISIWFNNMGVGNAGYEKGKQMAFTEISRLQKDIKDKKISMEQAGYQIKNNAALAQLDSSYRANAIFNFSVSDNQKITFSPEIDKQIYSLNQGDTSGVITGKDLDPATNQQIDSVYMVAQITKRSTTTVTSYAQWLEDKTKAYAVEKY